MSCPFYAALGVVLLLRSTAASSQVPIRDSIASTPLLLVGSGAEDRRRIDHVLGRIPPAGSLIRTASSLSDTAPLPWDAPRFRMVLPYAEMTWNSALPFSLNDGAQWAGRGLTVVVAGGVATRVGRVSLNLLPQIWRTENRSVPVLPGGDAQRKSFASPWHFGALSADIPLRFGYRSTTAIDPGESAVWITARGATAGVSTESQWWGPGQRNALLMSNNAGGVPHAFVRTATPFRTRFGNLEGRWIVGTLSESRYFDWPEENDLRSLSGAVVTFTPAREPHLTAGVARVVYANISGAGALSARALDVFARWNKRANIRHTSWQAADQLTSLFGRWLFPQSGAEIYGEWARILLPNSLRSLLVAPQFTQGFTIGAQWVTSRVQGPRYRVQLELTNLEQSPQSKAADTISFYTSPVVPQGYTHRGQVVGAAIGPGSSSQWLAVDRLARDFDAGAFLGRIRWDTDAYYTQSTSIYYLSYDATFFAGLRASARRLGRELSAELWAQRRYNYLFQNALDGFSEDPVFDRSNVTVRVRLY